MSENIVRLTPKQAKTASLVRDACREQRILPTSQMIQSAVAEAYDVTSSESARVIAARLMKMPEFCASLGFAAEEVQTFLFREIMANIKGENEVFPKSIDLARDSLKIAARLAWPETSKIVHTEEDTRSLEELREAVYGSTVEEAEERKRNAEQEMAEHIARLKSQQ